MWSLKKMIRSSGKKNTERLEKWLKPSLGKVGTRLKLGPRIRLLNRKASKYPKRTFGIVVSTLFLILAADVALTFSGTGRTNANPEISIASVDTVFSGFRTIQENKEIHRRTMADIALSGKEMKEKLDSLIALPEKSGKDSVEIKTTYRKLERLVKYLKKPDE